MRKEIKRIKANPKVSNLENFRKVKMFTVVLFINVKADISNITNR